MAAAALLCLALFPAAPAYGAETIEGLLDRSEQELNADELVEQLQQLRRNRIPVNSASVKQLLRIPFLTPTEAERIVAWRRKAGPILSPDALADVIGSRSAGRFSPFLTFEPSSGPRAADDDDAFGGALSARLFTEIPERKGIESGKYRGGNSRIYNRLQAGTRRYGIGVVQERDIGEPEFDDFISWNLHAGDIGVLDQAVLGDYRLNFGQGLVFGQGRYFSKGTDPVDGVLVFSPAVRPYSSSSEEGFLRGAVATISPGSFEVTAFASLNRIDASIDDGVVTSLSTDGYHRTTGELDGKDNLEQRAMGVNVRYRHRAGELSAGIGGTLAGYRYDKPVEWLDGGRQRQLTGIEANLSYREVQVFGETAFSQLPDAFSWICGIQAEIGRGVTGVASVRQYQVGYSSPFAGAFAERGDDGSNEEGFYVGLDAKVLKGLDVGASYDIFRFPELSDSYRLPSSGHDARVNVIWRHSPSLTFSGLYQHKQKEETKIQEEDEWVEYVMPVPKTTNRAQFNIEKQLSRVVGIKSRAEFKAVESDYFAGRETARGWLLYQQLNGSWGPITLKTRYTKFNTDSYDAAIYVYEDDLPQVYTLNSLSGRGQALFLLVGYAPTERLRLAAKFETVWYSDRDAYGSGNDLRVTSSPGSLNLGAMLKF